jgi:hypothetical protein
MAFVIADLFGFAFAFFTAGHECKVELAEDTRCDPDFRNQNRQILIVVTPETAPLS